MKPQRNLLILILIFVLSVPTIYAKKTEKIKLTGTTYENILMTLGNTGRTEIISAFPYTFEIAKEDLPIKLTFQSNNYQYYDIDIPQKPYDTTGHVYLVKVNEFAMRLGSNGQNLQNSNNNNAIGQSKLDTPIKGIDLSHGVNAAPITGIKNSNTYAIIITNEEYELCANVKNATNDGLAFKNYCINTLGIPNENIFYSVNVSFGKFKKLINDAISLITFDKNTPNLIVYYAGHGIPDNKSKEAYLMPIDADGSDTDICISLSSLYDKLNTLNTSHNIVFLDACFSGAQRGDDMIIAARGVKIKPKEVIPTGNTIIFSATSGDEAAFSYDQEEHGLFTYFLLEKFQKTKGNVSLGDLADFIKEKVSFESRRINKKPQTPTIQVPSRLENSWRKINLIK